MTEEKFYEDLLAIPNLKIDFIEKKKSQINFHCTIKNDEDKCPSCLSKTKSINQYDTRQVQDLRISGKEVWLYLRIPQFFCLAL